MAFDKELLDFLVCPQCKGDLQLSPNEDGLLCGACKLKFPIRDGIPIMLMNEAEDTSKADDTQSAI
ncbi:Trm112 family protein [Nitrospina sp. 32_T5]|uniref:Trm112 family protein n=1 Tax=unclassified Nitrospina TaxID=2638683 RepID=UPI003F980BF7